MPLAAVARKQMVVSRCRPHLAVELDPLRTEPSAATPFTVIPLEARRVLLAALTGSQPPTVAAAGAVLNNIGRRHNGPPAERPQRSLDPSR